MRISDWISDVCSSDLGYANDMGSAAATQPLAASTAHAALFVLPDAAWARRVSGVYSNDLTNQHPDRAHAVLTEKANGHYLISVRAPLNRTKGAEDRQSTRLNSSQ